MKKAVAFICIVLVAVTLATSVSAREFWDFTYTDSFGFTVRYQSRRGWDGYPDGTFHPHRTMTRAEFICCLYKFDDKHELKYYAFPSFFKEPVRKYSAAFSDVKAGSWYYDAVVWAYENGIVNGTGGGRFSPDSKIGVLEYALMMHRYYELRFDDSFYEEVDRFEDFTYVKDVIGRRHNYKYGEYSFLNSAKCEEMIKNAKLIDLPVWFTREVTLEELLKDDIWIGGEEDQVDMTAFSPTRGDIYLHFNFDYVEDYHGPS